MFPCYWGRLGTRRIGVREEHELEWWIEGLVCLIAVYPASTRVCVRKCVLCGTHIM